MKVKKKLAKYKFYTFEEHKKELMKDPEFVRTYQELQPEFEIIRNIIRARINKKITQKKLAARMKTKQSAISRLESGTANPSLNFLKRLAAALDSRLEIRLVAK